MSHFGTRTWTAKTGEVEQKWYVIDATDKTLGRMSTQVAEILRGKHKPTYTPNVDCGDFVVIINSDKIKVSGDKGIDKKYYWKPRWFGSLRELSTQQLIDKDSTELIRMSVKNMVPNGPLGRVIMSKLNVYKTAEHPHQAQRPEALTLKYT